MLIWFPVYKFPASGCNTERQASEGGKLLYMLLRSRSDLSIALQVGVGELGRQGALRLMLVNG